MKSIFEICKPRPEILKSQLRLSDFAARLKDVIDKNAHTHSIYRKPELFFENTYPTEGLKQLAQAVFGRMSGKDGGVGAIRLETSFGGGKTHDLIYLKEKGRQVDFGHLTDQAKHKILENYPFHPELLRVLDHKVGSLDNFQKTRGALMLLSKVVSNLWANQKHYPDTHLIHLHHIPLASEVLELLTSRLDKPEMKSPVLADICSSTHSAHAQQLDQPFLELKKPSPPYLGGNCDFHAFTGKISQQGSQFV